MKTWSFLGRAFSSGSCRLAGGTRLWSQHPARRRSRRARDHCTTEGHMTTRSIVAALVVALTLMAHAPASTQQAKCLAGKTACMAKKAAGVLKCEALAETPGKPVDPNAKDCVTKAETKFDGGAQPAKGCFEKLESKDPNDCLTVDDTVAAETAVDACVASLVAAIDPPPRDQTKCGAGKKKCASKYLAALLKCRKLAQTPGKPGDPNTKGCVDKAVAKYTGGLEPTKGCFAKLEAKDPNDCQSTTNSLTVQGLAENCVADLVAVVAGPASTTSTTIATTSTTLTTTTTMPPGGLCNPACVLPATCVLGVCRAPCGATSCRQANPPVELCCTTMEANGTCCDYDTQVCNGSTCRTVICGPDETFVPSAGGCCFNFDLCAGNRVCCPAGFFCAPDGETCVSHL